MGKFDTMTMRECVARLRDLRPSIREGKAYAASGNASDIAIMRAELKLREEAIELRARLLQIEVEERDACSIALQHATLEAEEARANT